MTRGLYGIAHDLPYRRDGDSAFRELVKMLMNEEVLGGGNERISSVSGDETLLSGPAASDEYVQHIKDGILGVSLLAIVLIILILVMVRRPGERGGGSPANQSSRSQSDQSRNTIIDLEGKTRVGSLDVGSSSSYV